VPISSLSGTFVSGVNAFNGSNQYNYAAKHNPQVFFTDSNGGNELDKRAHHPDSGASDGNPY
jgi:phosphatidylinositol-3-phosphatase